MAARLCIFLIVSLFGSMLARESRPELVIWNVGQGQWATLVDQHACWHFDMGGEFAPWLEVEKLCRHRQNRVSLSHWDIDHIGFIERVKARLPDLCLVNAPLGSSSARKEALLQGVKHCPPSATATTRITPMGKEGSLSKMSDMPRMRMVSWSDPTGRTANEKSWVVLWQKILVPGDSPTNEEKKWIHQLPGLASTRYLILGHHGSRTSTSKDLLRVLPALILAVSSARKRRYGHPHPEVVQRLANFRIPLLLTEEWGSIHIAL